MALTAASEHVTTISPGLFWQMKSGRASAEFRKIWYYHALEEIEHKAVAFDVYKEVKGPTWLRLYSLIQVGVVLPLFLTQLMACFLSKEKNLLSKSGRQELWLFLKQMIKASPVFFKSYISFFKPSFHPQDEEDQNLVEIYRRKVSSFLLLIKGLF